MEADTSLLCCVQFLIRQEDASDQLLNKIISSIPVEAENPRIRKELLIRGIMSNVSEGTEAMLDSFESLEKLDREEGVHVSASMKRAYCKVALYCTVRHLGPLAFKRRNYKQAVERIWRGRIRGLESRNSELVTDELKAVMDDIEGAVLDDNVRMRLLGMSTRRDAFKWTEVYSKEALTAMGRPFLELVAETHVQKQSVEAEEEDTVENEGENVNASGEDIQNEVVGTRGLDELDGIVVEDEEDNKGDDVAREDPILMQSPCSNQESDEDVGEDDNIVVEDPILARPGHSNEERGEQMNCGGNGAEAENIRNSLYNDGEGSAVKASETQAENSKAKVTVSLVNSTENKNAFGSKLFPEVAPRSKCDTLTTPAVESLRASSSALGKVVVYPLPNALRKAKAVQLEIVQDEHDGTGEAVDNEERPTTLMKLNATTSSFEVDLKDKWRNMTRSR